MFAIGAAILVFSLTVGLGKSAWRFVSGERKPGHYRSGREPGGRLPLVGGPALLLGIGAAAWAGGSQPTLVVLLAGLGFFVNGFIDDLCKARRGIGISETMSLLGGGLAAAWATAVLLWAEPGGGPLGLAHWVDNQILLAIWYFALCLAIAVAMGFCDGMDGLAPGLALLGLISLAIAGGSPWPDSPALLLAGGALGFFLLNLPSAGGTRLARAYLGDSGALLLGGSLAAAAVVSGLDLLLPIAAAVVVLEGLSAVVQAKLLVPLYRRSARLGGSDHATRPYTQFRLPFIATPLHHHLDLCGLGRFRTTLLLLSGQAGFGALAVAAALLGGVLAAVLLAVGAVLAGLAAVAIASLRPARILVVSEPPDPIVVSLRHGRWAWLSVERERLLLEPASERWRALLADRPTDPDRSARAWAALKDLAAKR